MLRRVIRAIAATAAICVISLTITIVLVEFLAQCGEKTYYEDGTWETNECVFIPYTTTTGTWR